jgi:membrane-bound lytic murein transglycosylase D
MPDLKLKANTIIQFCAATVFLFCAFVLPSTLQSQTRVPEDSVISARLRQISGEIILPWSEEITTEFKSRLHLDETRKLLEAFFTIHLNVKEELKKRQLPQQLMVLPIVMSAMDPLYFSETNKAGLWGLDAAPAIRFGLNITPGFDERYNNKKSMNTAMEYLEFLYEEYQDWWLALLVYTNGPVVAAQYLDQHQKNEKDPREMLKSDFISNKKFISEFIFFNYLIYYFDEHKIKPLIRETSEEPIVVLEVKKKIIANDFFEKCSTDVKSFRIHNPEYISGPIDTGSYVFHVTESVNQLFEQWKDSLYLWAEKPRVKELPVNSNTEQKGNGQSMTYVIRSGDNLGSIANRYGVTVSQLKEWNNLKSDLIHPGQKLIIYTKKTTTKNTTVTSSTSNNKNTVTKTGTSNDGYVTYTVKQGDSLWSISQKFEGVSDSDIKKLNNISGTTIYPGQVLKIKKK